MFTTGLYRTIAAAILAGAGAAAFAAPPATPSTVPPPASVRRERIADFALRYGFPPPQLVGSLLKVADAGGSLLFENNSRRVVVNGVTVWMNAPVLALGGWTLDTADADRTLDPLFRPEPTTPIPKDFLIVLDPGHGGSDPGALGRSKAVEKKATLDLAKRVRRKLVAQGRQNVRLTRSWDFTTTSLAERSARAKAWGAHVFVSIHLNSASNPQAEGLETYACANAGCPSTAGLPDPGPACAGNQHDPENALLAYAIHQAVLYHARVPDRGVRRSRFAVLQNAPCPAALIECGFISHAGEEAKLLTPAHRDAVATGIAQGIETYLTRVYCPISVPP
jgi:N-acetylmuramoyl-L-alanine amidase